MHPSFCGKYLLPDPDPGRCCHCRTITASKRLTLALTALTTKLEPSPAGRAGYNGGEFPLARGWPGAAAGSDLQIDIHGGGAALLAAISARFMRLRASSTNAP
jgi:hypothetical protein